MINAILSAGPFWCEKAAGQQSPINLCGAELFSAANNTALEFSDCKPDAYLYLTGADTMTLNAHDIPKIVGRQTTTYNITWKFAQAHLHWGRDGHVDEGSEHYIEGVQHPLEIHFVHHNSKYEDLTAALASGEDDALLVVGQFFAIDDTVSTTPAAFQAVSAALLLATSVLSINPEDLIDQSGGFYSYAGSLTTPTCNPVVTWVVMANVIGIPHRALENFHDKTHVSLDNKLVGSFGNFRPLQPRGTRTVYMTSGVASTTCNSKGGREPHFPCSECGADFHTRSTLPSEEIMASRPDMESEPVSLASIFESRRAGSDWSWDRCDAVKGPAGWGTTVAGSQCNAGEQSPIDLCCGIPLPEDRATTLKFDYPAEEILMKLNTDGQYLQANGAETMTLNAHDIPKIVGRQVATETTNITWKFAQAHFHWGRDGYADEGSEHYIEGLQHPLEIHFVHHNSEYDDLSTAVESGNADALLVVGQMFTVEDTMSSGGTEKHIVGAFAVAGRRAGESSWNWDRCDDHQGPTYWPSNSGAFCNAEEQSPIDLCGAEGFPVGTGKTTLDFRYPTTDVAMELNTDGQAYLSPTGADTMTLNAHDIPKIVGRQMGGSDITWKFTQAHFHWGRDGHSDEGLEHYIEGVQHPLEIHFVHHNSEFADLGAALTSGKKDALLVVGQFFEVGGTMSAALTAITGAFATASSTANRHSINVKPLELINQSGGFYSYAGSLTTPTCNLVVTWVVMSKVMTITIAGLNSFHDKTLTSTGGLVDYGNFRPLQDRAGRPVYMSAGVKTLPCHPNGARQPQFACSGCGHEANAALSAIVSGLATASAGDFEVDIRLKPADLIDITGGFYSYAGSLTTPTCNPVVTWVVMSKVMMIPSIALDHFQDKTMDREGHKATFGNFRPLQARDGRTVYMTKGVTTSTCRSGGAREPYFSCDSDFKCDTTCLALSIGLEVGVLLISSVAYIAVLTRSKAAPKIEPNDYNGKQSR